MEENVLPVPAAKSRRVVIEFPEPLLVEAGLTRYRITRTVPDKSDSTNSLVDTLNLRT
jgi:hypothetical protein